MMIHLEERRPSIVKEEAELLLQDPLYCTEERHSESSSSVESSEQKYDYEQAKKAGGWLRKSSEL
jgi:hypothetical protein